SVRHIFKPISYLEIQLLSGVSGGYITEYERRARFNKDDYKPTPDEVRRFPSRPKLDQTEHNISLDLITPIQSESKRKYIPRLKPPNHR
ncbi:hypothetical protein ACOY9O_24270, partial [Enterobacter asburiae]